MAVWGTEDASCSYTQRWLRPFNNRFFVGLIKSWKGVLLMASPKIISEAKSHEVFLVLLFVFFFIGIGSASNAQTSSGTVNGETATPIPNVGHDYIHMLSETIDPSTGSVNLHIAFPVENSRGLTLPLSLSYSTSGLFVLTNGQPGQEILAPPITNPYFGVSGGWGYTYPRSTYSATDNSKYGSDGTYEGTEETYTSYIFVAPDGTSHNLGLGWQCLIPASGNPSCPELSTGGSSLSELLAFPDSGYTAGFTPPYSLPQTLGNYQVFDTNGTTYSFNATGAYSTRAGPGGYIPYEIEDRNGNTIYPTVTSNGASTPTYTITFPDTAGRTGYSISGTEQPGSYDTVTVGGLTYKVYWTTTSANYSVPGYSSVGSFGQACAATNFAASASGTITVISKIELPNGQYYSFTYGNNPYGLLSEIRYPDGGWVQYTYRMSDTNDLTGLFSGWAYVGSSFIQVPKDCPYEYSSPVVATRTVSFNGTNVAQIQDFTNYTTTFSSTPYYWTDKATTVQTVDEVNNKQFQTIYNYSPISVGAPPYTNDAVATQIAVESTVSTYDWGNTTAPLVVETKSWANPYAMTEDDRTVAGQTSSVIYTPSSAFPTEVDEYDFNATTPTKKILTTYQQFNVSSVMASPCKVLTEAGSGAVLSEIDTYYDGGTSLCANDTAAVSTAPVSSLPNNSHDETLYSSSSTTPRGNVSKIVSVLASGASPSRSYAYDETGQVSTATDGNGNTTQYSFMDNPSGGNAAGNSNVYLTKVTRPTVNGIALVDTYAYNYAIGQLVSKTDVNNNQTTHYYYNDSLNRITQINSPDGGIQMFGYNDSASSPSVTTCKLLNASSTSNPCPITGSPTGNWMSSQSIRDGMGHVVQVTTDDPYGNDTVTTAYDGIGNIYSETNPERSSSSSTDGTTYRYYDSLGRQIEEVETDGHAFQWCYNGTASTPAVQNCSARLGSVTAGVWVDVTDENGNHAQHTSDSFGRLIEVMEPEGTSQSPIIETDYSYDVLDDLLSVTQWGGPSGISSPIIRSFSYDSLSRLLTSTNPESGTISYSYDADGNVLSKISPSVNTASGTQIICYYYDSLSRITSELLLTQGASNCSSPSTYQLLATYAYDSSPITNARYPVQNTAGRLTDEKSYAGNTLVSERQLYSYDPIGRLLDENQITFNATSDTNAYSLDYRYDLAGDLSASTDGTIPVQSLNAQFLCTPPADVSGWTTLAFVYCYDGAGHTSSVVSNWAAWPINLFTAGSTNGYAPTGQLQNWTQGGAPALSVTQSYTNRLWLNGITATGQVP